MKKIGFYSLLVSPSDRTQRRRNLHFRIYSRTGRNGLTLIRAESKQLDAYCWLVCPTNGITGSGTQTKNRSDRITIPEINLDVPVEVARAVTMVVDEKEYVHYLVPEKFAASYHENSAPLGDRQYRDQRTS